VSNTMSTTITVGDMSGVRTARYNGRLHVTVETVTASGGVTLLIPEEMVAEFVTTVMAGMTKEPIGQTRLVGATATSLPDGV